MMPVELCDHQRRSGHLGQMQCLAEFRRSALRPLSTSVKRAIRVPFF